LWLGYTRFNPDEPMPQRASVKMKELLPDELA
jgi:hypothetical protein